MSWNYRTMERGEEHKYYEIVEVYYDDNGGIQGWTENGVGPFSNEGIDELKRVYEMMAEAFEKPMLIEKDIVCVGFKLSDIKDEELIDLKDVYEELTGEIYSDDC